MDQKELFAIVFGMLLILVGCACMAATAVHGADLNVTRDFDNVTIYHTVKSDSGSQTVQGIENNAKLMSKDGKLMANGIYEDDSGRYEYDGMYLNDTLLGRSDRVYFKDPVLLTAHYKFTPFCNAEIIVNDPQGNADRHATFPHMTKEGDSLTQIFAEPCDFDTVHYDFWYIQDQDTGKIFAPDDNYTITYSDCVANGGSITKVFEYVYGFFPDYTVTYISINNETGLVFDNVTETINRENWSAFYTLPNAPEVAHKILDYVLIVEDGITNYVPGNTYEAMYDMAMCEGNNLTRTFIYFYKEGAYANVTVNYIFNIDNELNNTIFHREYYPYLLVGDEAVGGYVDYHVNVEGYNFTGVTFKEVISNGVKAMLPGSNVRDEGGFWIYSVDDIGDITLNFLYNYKAIEVKPTPEPTPAPGNDTSNDTNETEPDVPEPVVPDVPVVDNETNKGDDKDVPMDNISNTTNNYDIWIANNDTNGTSQFSDEHIVMKETGNPVGWLIAFIMILLFAIACIVVDKRDED